MARIVGVTSCPTGVAHSFMAAAALEKTAAVLGHVARIEIHSADGARDPLTDDEIAEADVVVLAADIHVGLERFAGKPVLEVSTSRAIRHTQAVIEEALACAPSAGTASAAAPTASQPERSVAAAPTSAGKFIVAITACPTGIAHTFMAAAALKNVASAAGHEIRVETQGSVGAKNQLTAEEIARADVVIISADTHVDAARFVGKPLHRTSVGAAVKQAASVLDAALALVGRPVVASAASATVSDATGTAKERQAGAYKHLLTGVSYMLPLVVAGGLTIALSFVLGIHAAEEPGTLAAALMSIGGGAAFALMVPVLSGFIAYSIADRPGLAPGLIGGMLAANLKAGFLGGIASGFLAGYVAKFFRDRIRLPANLEGLKPVLVIPLLSTLVVGLAMVYVIGTPVRMVMEHLTAFLQGMGTANAAVLGFVLGGMMAVDMGGPVNKAAYSFAVGLLTSQTFQPMAAVMAAGMTPPLGISIATMVGRSRFTRDEREAGKAAGVLGLAFITEGAIPFAAKDPLRVIPPMVAGSAVTGALSMYFGCGLRAPHGGVFVLAIPNAVSHLGGYVVAIVAGTVVTTIALLIAKKPLADA